MHFPKIFKNDHHKDEKHVEVEHREEKKEAKEHQKHYFFEHNKDNSKLPKGFANDATRTTKQPDTLYGFDDPTARRLGPVPTQDPTNTGA